MADPVGTAEEALHPDPRRRDHAARVDHLRMGYAFRNGLRAILLQIRSLHGTLSFMN